MKHYASIIAVAALIVCAACADKTSQSSFVANAPVQYSTVVWTDLATQDQVAQVKNQRLIFQR